jgi:hypothetical protein
VCMWKGAGAGFYLVYRRAALPPFRPEIFLFNRSVPAKTFLQSIRLAKNIFSINPFWRILFVSAPTLLAARSTNHTATAGTPPRQQHQNQLHASIRFSLKYLFNLSVFQRFPAKNDSFPFRFGPPPQKNFRVNLHVCHGCSIFQLNQML